MRVLLGVVVLGAVALVGALAWAMRYDELAPITPPAPVSFDRDLLERGELLAGMGDCEVCHTRRGGEPFAGGLALPTPFGVIYTTNITPDAETGIGAWSEQAFLRAMHEGIDREGSYLYPAFPYNHFTKVTPEDVHAIYAFVMTQRPVKYIAPQNELPFPFNIRLGIAGWNLLYLKKGVYQPDPAKDEDWNRGAYLVEGIGHCGSCHTPLNVLGAEQGGAVKFAGGAAEGWHVPALNGASPAPFPWTVSALVNYLYDGWDKQHGITAGPMTAVIRHLADQEERDIFAIAEYIASFQPPVTPDRLAEVTAFANEREWNADAPPRFDDAAVQRGATEFQRVCANCHKRGGQPLPLGLTSTVNMPDPRNVIRITLEGIRAPAGAQDRSMPGFDKSLTDDDLHDMIVFMRRHYTTKPAWDDLREHIGAIRRAANP